jgi:Domain of unknown function (DUF6457)
MDHQLEQWLAALSAELGTADLAVSGDTIRTLLDLARDSAHQVTRVSAPLTTFLVGVAVGRGASVNDAAARTTALLQSREHGSSVPQS